MVKGQLVVKKRCYGRKKSKPTSAKRSKIQSIDDRYAHAREDAQLAGRIPTTPEEALTSERVDPSSQSEQLLAALVVRAARESWSTPAEKKGVIVDELVKVVESKESRSFDKIAAANALGKLDQIQYERDNPEQAGKAKGVVNIDNKNEVTVVDLGELFRKVDEQRNGKKDLPCGIVELPAERLNEVPKGETDGNSSESVRGGRTGASGSNSCQDQSSSGDSQDEILSPGG